MFEETRARPVEVSAAFASTGSPPRPHFGAGPRPRADHPGDGGGVAPGSGTEVGDAKLPNGLPVPFARLHARRPAVMPIGTDRAWDTSLTQGLAVDAWPASDLHSGDTVRVTSNAFGLNKQVGVTVCASQVGLQGQTYCDLTHVFYGQTTQGGSLDMYVTVQRQLSTPKGRFDCAEGNVDPDQFRDLRDRGRAPTLTGPDAWTCVVVAGDLANLSASGGYPVRFDPDAA